MINELKGNDQSLGDMIAELNKELNSKQLVAATTTSGPVIVIAGAGAGKTKVLVHRVATMIMEGVNPGNIMVVTFTKKAASELQERLFELIGEPAENIAAGTFHSIIFQKMLKRFHGHRFFDDIGLDISQTAILDESDSKKLLNDAIDNLDEVDKAHISNENWTPNDIMSVISAERSKGNDIKAFKKTFDSSQENDRKKEISAKIWKRYEALCRQSNSIDFDDILVVCNQFFKAYPAAAKEMSNEFNHLMLDEYQDTNKVQMSIMDAIARYHENIFVVGDEKQSIYGFRGSDINVILGFKKRYPNSVQIEMDYNYRSKQNIIDLANVCAENMGQKLSNGQMKRGRKGAEKVATPIMTSYNNEGAESFGIAKRIRADLQKGKKGEDIAILYRKRASKSSIEKALLEMEIPYTIVGDTAFFQRAEVKDATAMLRFIVNPWDTIAGIRFLNGAKIGISGDTIRKGMKTGGVGAWAHLQLTSAKRLAAKKVGELGKKSSAANKASDLLLILENVRKSLVSSKTSVDQKIDVLTRFWDLYLYDSVSKNLKSTSAEDKVAEKNGRLQNVETIIGHIKRELEKGNKPEDIVVDLELLSEAKSNDKDMTKRVRMMTVHASKGLEFDDIYLVGADNQNMPDKGSSSREIDEEEERRIFYVAVTRAKKNLHISSASKRLDKGVEVSVERSLYSDEVRNNCKQGLKNNKAAKVSRTPRSANVGF